MAKKVILILAGVLVAAGLAVSELTHERVTLEHFFFAETKGKL